MGVGSDNGVSKNLAWMHDVASISICILSKLSFGEPALEEEKKVGEVETGFCDDNQAGEGERGKQSKPYTHTDVGTYTVDTLVLMICVQSGFTGLPGPTDPKSYGSNYRLLPGIQPTPIYCLRTVLRPYLSILYPHFLSHSPVAVRHTPPDVLMCATGGSDPRVLQLRRPLLLSSHLPPSIFVHSPPFPSNQPSL
ncbi:unnamed protein product [Leuciscus chuanchicus]